VKITNSCLLATFSAVLVLSGCDDSQKENSKSKEVIAISDQYLLNKSEIQRLEQLGNNGDSQAARRLSFHYLLVGNDVEKAFHWNKVAARNGDAKAQMEVGIIFATGDQPLKQRDFNAARYWLKKAADNGEKEAQEYLDLLLGKKEVDELTKKALSGDKDAAYKVYDYYHSVERNYDKWIYWLEVAAKNGHAEAQYIHGARLINADKKKALYWLKKAADQGHEGARITLKELNW
jgi:uncharacterized protein